MGIIGPETIRNTPYKEVVKGEVKNPAFNELFEYDNEGNLLLKRHGIKVVDLLSKYGDPFDAPIQFTDTTVVTKRARDLKDIFGRGAELSGYPKDRLQFHYAAKANFKAPVIAAALKEVHMETSGELDLYNFELMRRRGIIPKDKKVICNGYKSGRRQNFDKGYAERIIDAHENGADITPVLVQNELPFYQERVKKGVLSVGLRLKFGVVSSEKDLSGLVSRFGFDWQDLEKEAEKIKSLPNLEFTMLHAMSSAASAVNPEAFAKSALIAAEKYAILKRNHPSLTYLNLGGGIPSFDTGYDYNAFIVPFLTGVKSICAKYGVELPTVVIESGSFIATDCESLVYRVIDVSRNSADGAPWISLGGILTNLPDIWIQEDPFTFVAANNANEPLTGVRIGDLTCDSNNVYPPKDQPEKLVLMPKKFEGLAVVAINTGAYQDNISGVGSAKEAKMVNHCGNAEPIQVYITKNRKGGTRIVSGTRTSIQEMSNIVGFGEGSMILLK